MSLIEMITRVSVALESCAIAEAISKGCFPLTICGTYRKKRVSMRGPESCSLGPLKEAQEQEAGDEP